MAEEALSKRQARRIALDAQGFGGARAARRSGPVARSRLGAMIESLGAIQIDSVNVVARSHYLPAFARLGLYDVTLLERAAWGRRPTLFEYWGHEASLMPVEMQPLFRWRMDRARHGDTWSGLATFGRQRRDFIDEVLRRIEVEGPLTGGDFADGPRQSGWWNWSHGKKALEWLFWAGLITTRTRRGFERVYDLTERVLPRTVIEAPTPAEADAKRALLLIAAKALGVATAADLRDYFRLPPPGVAERLAELVEGGELVAVQVEGWRHGAYRVADARARRCTAAALLSPFDNLIWCRDRAERLFGARIRLEIYTPAHKREHGYYVLPFLIGESIAARVDLKSDRARRRLLVQAAHLERGALLDETTSALAVSLCEMSGWLGLEGVEVTGKGDLSSPLEHALKAA